MKGTLFNGLCDWPFIMAGQHLGNARPIRGVKPYNSSQHHFPHEQQSSRAQKLAHNSTAEGATLFLETGVILFKTLQ